MAKKNKVFELQGTKLQKICMFLQIIVILVVLGVDIYVNVNNIENSVLNNFNEYLLPIVLILMFIPTIIEDKKNK